MKSNLRECLQTILEEKEQKIIPGNIREGVTILGVTGSLNDSGIDTSDANATNADILIGKSGYVNNIKIEGSMPNNGELSYTPSTENQTIPAGYTSGGTIVGDSDLKSSNIIAGVSIFGVEGTIPLLGNKVYTPTESTQVETLNGHVETITINPVDIETLSDYNDCYVLSTEILGLPDTEFTQLDLYAYLDARDYEEGNIMTDKMGNWNVSVTSTATKTDDIISFSGNGHMQVTNMTYAQGTYEIYLKIPSTYDPIGATEWYQLGAIMGNEYSGAVRDYGVVIDSNGYLAIGYSLSSIKSSTVKILDDKWHHVVLTYQSGVFKLYCDGSLIATVNYTMSGTLPSYFGILWNGANTWSPSYIPCDFAYFRYYTRVLTEEELQVNLRNAQSLGLSEEG